MVHNYGRWKYVFIKGRPSDVHAQGPGVYIHPRTNKLRFEITTTRKIRSF